MSKRNVAYVKPQDPSFLAKLKAQLGPSNEPTIDTKRQKLQDDYASDSDSDGHVKDDEKPQIVVLQNGDLTAEEVERIAKEATEAPADLTQRVIFRKRKTESSKSTNAATAAVTAEATAATIKPTATVKSIKSTTTTTATKHTKAKSSSSNSASSRSSVEQKKVSNVKLSFLHDDDKDDE